MKRNAPQLSPNEEMLVVSSLKRYIDEFREGGGIVKGSGKEVLQARLKRTLGNRRFVKGPVTLAGARRSWRIKVEPGDN